MLNQPTKINLINLQIFIFAITFTIDLISIINDEYDK